MDSDPADPSQPNQHTKMSERLHSPSRWVRTLVMTGIVIFIANFAIAWVFAFWSQYYVTHPLVERPLVKPGRDVPEAKGREGYLFGATELAMEMIDGANPNTCVFLNRAMESEVHLKYISNMQAIMIVGMACGFGLIAVGFSLFVMGIQGAYEFRAGTGDDGTVILKATSPGHLCFLLAAVLILFALSRDASVKFNKFKVFDQSGSQATEKLGFEHGPVLPIWPYITVEEGKK